MLIRNQYFRKNPAYPMAGRIIALPPGNAKPLKITSNIDDLAFTVISIYEISAFTMRTRIISAFRQKYSCQTSSTLLQYTYLNREFQRYGVGQNNSSGTPFLFYSQKTVYRAISRQASGSVYGRFKSAKTDKVGYVDYEGSKVLVVNGKLADKVNGLSQDPEHTDDWYFCSNVCAVR